MRFKRLFLSLLVLVAASAGVSAQTREFSWSDFVCDFKGTYDPAAVTEQQLTDTRALIDFGMGLPLETEHTVWDPSEISRLDVNKLDAEYTQVREKLMGLNPVPNEYFKTLKARHLKVLERSYELKRATLLAHTDGSALEGVKDTEACFTKWGKPVMAGGDPLLTAWKVLLEEQKTRNASPEGLQTRFNQRYDSPERGKWALIEVLGFGWWNCVNSSIPYVDNDGTTEEEFAKLFVKVESLECDEPE